MLSWVLKEEPGGFAFQAQVQTHLYCSWEALDREKLECRGWTKKRQDRGKKAIGWGNTVLLEQGRFCVEV